MQNKGTFCHCLNAISDSEAGSEYKIMLVTSLSTYNSKVYSNVPTIMELLDYL